MIDLGQPALYAEGVTLFRDHADPTLFHYLPGAPRLRRRDGGELELSLLKYRLDPELHRALGAGLLALTVDLGVDEERLDRVRRRAARAVGDGRPATLTPVAADSGSCELVLIDRASRDEAAPVGEPSPPSSPPSNMVERILGASTPALYGSNAAAFQAVLSAEGTALVEGALARGGLPVGVVYELRVPGLRPALRAEIIARWRQVYDFFEARLHGGKLLAAVDVGPTMEDLVQSEAITVRIDELVPEGERLEVHRRALEHAERYVLETLFKPSLGGAPPADPGDGGALATIGDAIKDLAGFFTIRHSLRHLDRSELKTLHYRLHAAQAELITLAPQGTLTALAGEDDLSALVVEVEPAASAEMRFDVAAAVDLAAQGVDHLEVTLTYGDRRESLLLDGDTPRREVVLWHRPELGPGVGLAWEAHLVPDSGAGLGGILAAPPATVERRVLRLDPRDLFDVHDLRLVAQGVPFDRYPRVVVDLEAEDRAAGWSAGRTVELTAAAPEAAWRVRAGRGAPVRRRRRVRWLEADGGEIDGGWEPVEGSFSVVGDPLPEVVDVLVLGSARFGTAVRRLIVELRPRSAPERVTTRVLTGDEPSAAWSFQPGGGDGRDYEYRLTVHTARGELREGEWQPGPPGKLVVGEGGALRRVELLFVGRSPQELGLLALKVRFAYQDAESGLSVEEEVLVEDPRKPLEWSYPVAHPDRRAFTYELTLIHADGRVEKRDPVRTADLLAIAAL